MKGSTFSVSDRYRDLLQEASDDVSRKDTGWEQLRNTPDCELEQCNRTQAQRKLAHQFIEEHVYTWLPVHERF